MFRVPGICGKPSMIHCLCLASKVWRGLPSWILASSMAQCLLALLGWSAGSWMELDGEMDGTFSFHHLKWMMPIFASTETKNRKYRCRYWPTVTNLHYSDLFLPVKRSSFKSQNWAPRVAFHTMKFSHRHGADGAKGPGKSRLRWSWMRWLSLRGWHWWLQWWADRLWQREDLGISGALGGENRRASCGRCFSRYAVCGWKLSLWVFHIHGVVPELKCHIDNQIWQMIASKVLQPTTSSNSNRLPRSDWDASLGRKGLGNPVTYWRGVVLRLYFLLLLFAEFVHPSRVMFAISIHMSQLDSPLLVNVCFLTFEIYIYVWTFLCVWPLKGLFGWEKTTNQGILHKVLFGCCTYCIFWAWWKRMQVPSWFDFRLWFFCLEIGTSLVRFFTSMHVYCLLGSFPEMILIDSYWFLKHHLPPVICSLTYDILHCSAVEVPFSPCSEFAQGNVGSCQIATTRSPLNTRLLPVEFIFWTICWFLEVLGIWWILRDL